LPIIRALVVEDNAGDVELLRIALSEATRDPVRFAITEAPTLARAREQLMLHTAQMNEGGAFDVLLLDLSLPDSQGLATIDAVHELGAASPATALPIVVLTGNENDADALAALQRGAQDYLVKGQADGRLLGRTLRYAIERKRAERAQLDKEIADKERAEAERASRALEESNRAILALYQELDERAQIVRRASELKSRFLSNMSHEFRTPLHSIIGIAGLLRDQSDGPLNDEQVKQVAFVQQSAVGLLAMVDDLLDLAKIESGSVHVNAEDFGVPELFTGLRSMFRAIWRNDDVDLVFDDVAALPRMMQDQTKLAQIMRNLISNALKFTERGSVRVSARMAAPDRVAFIVADTGIGIAREDHERVFGDFTQVESPRQRKVKGTGLGLPLVRSLARVLGGDVSLASALGEGAVFTVEVPRAWRGPP
jgi:signal transduction histidine kinase